MAGTRGRRASGARRPGSAGPHGARRGGRGQPRRRLARAPSCAAAAPTPRRCPAEQPLKRRQPPRSERRGGGPTPGQWPRRSGARPWRGSTRCVLRRLARRGPRAEPAVRSPPSRDRAAGAVQAAAPAPSAARRLPGRPPPWHAGLRPTSAPPPPARALAALRPPPLRRPQRFPARRIPGNCARPRPALPLGFLGLVVRARWRPRLRGPRDACSRPGDEARDQRPLRLLRGRPCSASLLAPARPALPEPRDLGGGARPRLRFVSKRLASRRLCHSPCPATDFAGTPHTPHFFNFLPLFLKVT